MILTAILAAMNRISLLGSMCTLLLCSVGDR